MHFQRKLIFEANRVRRIVKIPASTTVAPATRPRPTVSTASRTIGNRTTSKTNQSASMATDSTETTDYSTISDETMSSDQNGNATGPEGAASDSSGLDVIVPAVVGSLIGLLALVVIIIIIVYLYKKYRLRTVGRYGPLYKTYEDTQNTMDLSRLIRVADRIIGSDVDADEFVQSIGGTTVDKKELIALTNVRQPAVRLKKSSQLLLKGVGRSGHRLHMTQLRDYYGNNMFLCQAHLPRQFADQWRMIWQERVAVVLWVGPFKEGDEDKLQPYVSIRKRTKIRCSEFVLETTMCVRKPAEYDCYLVQASKGKAKRRIIILHIHCWPDSGTPLVPQKLADFVAVIQEQHEKEQKDQNLSGIIFYCSAGVQRSPTLLALFIARQMWYQEHKVNLLGIFRYIRQRRYKAWDMGNSIAQVQIAFGVMELIATRREMGKHFLVSTLVVEHHERETFNRPKRQEMASVPDQVMESYSRANTASLGGSIGFCLPKSLKITRPPPKTPSRPKQTSIRQMTPPSPPYSISEVPTAAIITPPRTTEVTTSSSELLLPAPQPEAIRQE